MSIAFSIALFFTVALCYNASCPACYSPSNPYWTMQRLLQEPLFYLLCFITPIAALLPRFFYRACQGTLFPSPVQLGRQLDKLPADIRRNILSLSRVKVGSPLCPKLPFLSLAKASPKGYNKKDRRSVSGSKQGPLLQTDEAKRSPLQPTDSDMHLSDLYTPAPSEVDTLPYTKDNPAPSGELQTSSAADSEHLDKTIEPSDVNLSSCVTSTPLPAQADGVQLSMPPDGASQCVRYTRNSEERLKSEHAVSPAHRTEPPTERPLQAASFSLN